MKDSKGIKSVLRTHNQEIKEIKDTTQVPGPQFHKMMEVINEIFTNYKHI
jgi:hypothetical protein